jgi:osmoprotectant transport system substrate-binding protein
MKRIYLLLAALSALAMTLTACASSGSSAKTSGPAASGQPAGSSTASAGQSAYPAEPGSLTIGSAAFPESEILANIYADAMSAKGVHVTKKLDIGERPAYMAALRDGSIDFFPEYSGSILSYLDPAATAKTPGQVYAALQSAAAGQHLVALAYSPAQDSDTITVTKATAQKYHLTSIADLKPIASKLTFGAPAQFKTRADGLPALKSVYGVVFGTFTPLQAGGSITVTSLTSGSIDAGDIFSTDPAIAKHGFVSLQDPQSMFAAQNIVPIATAAKLSQPAVDAADAVSAKLDTKTLAELVSQVANGKDAVTVAKAWLASVGLG